MKHFARVAVSVGLVVAAGNANAQMGAPYDTGRAHSQAASDFEGPYGPPPMPPAPSPRSYGYGPDYGSYGPDYGRYGPDYGRYGPDYGSYGPNNGSYGPNNGSYGPNNGRYGPDYGSYGPNNGRYGPDYDRYGGNYDGYGPRYGDRSPYGNGPSLMPLPQVYAVLRENGFSPLGTPHRRGYVWVIAAVDRAGQNGRLLIDGRSGQIIRFTPKYRWGSAYDRMRYGGGLRPPDGAQAALAAPTVVAGPPRPPASVPHFASRAVPMAPKPVTSSKPSATPQQSAAVEAKPARAPPPPQAPAASQPPQPGATIAQSKVAPPILPTQQMPKVQGLE